MTDELIIQFLELIKTDVINSLQQNGKAATGQIANQITIVRDENNITLQLPGYLKLLETGRRPTSSDAVLFDPPMIDRIRQWCQEKGIPETAVWAIKKSIDKRGFKGVAGLLTVPLGDDNINTRLEPTLDAIATEAVKQIIEGLE